MLLYTFYKKIQSFLLRNLFIDILNNDYVIYYNKERKGIHYMLNFKKKFLKFFQIFLKIFFCLFIFTLLFFMLFKNNLLDSYYRNNVSEAKKIYQEEYIKEKEKNIRTKSLPDIKISIHKFQFIKMNSKEKPVYSTNLRFTSAIIDQYYATSKSELCKILQEVDNNVYLNFSDCASLKKHHRIMVNQDFNRGMTIQGNKHSYTYNYNFNDGIDEIYIDNVLAYSEERDFEYPEDSSTEEQVNSPIQSHSSSHSSYDDGYNSVIEDGEYDLDKYYKDDSYQSGVDDAQEEMNEDY